MSWLANLAAYGWGLPVLVVLGIVLAIIFILSVAAIVWRYIFPAPAAGRQIAALPTQLTAAERRLIILTAELWNGFLDLPDNHPADQTEMRRDIHDIQHRIMARVARRNEPGYFR